MPSLRFSSVIAALFIATSCAQTTLAQTIDSQSSAVITPDNQILRNKRIRRVVQPIAYWVDTNSLKLRDNPVSGKVLGKLEYGQKILAYSQYENWVRVSKTGANPKWVNSDFLSNSRLSWARYDRMNSTPINDIVSARIKDPENKKKRIFGVRLKTADTGNALLTTREETAEGIFYQNHFVSCEGQRPVGIRLVGEGRNFLSAQGDIRNLAVDIYDTETINDKVTSSAEMAVSTFACQTESF